MKSSIISAQVGEFNGKSLREGGLAFADEWKALVKLDEGDRFGWKLRFEAGTGIDWIEKANGKLRPLGIPTVKDRVVQCAVKLIIEPIFEADFHDCSFGFRPNRSAQQAVDRIAAEIKAGKLNGKPVYLQLCLDQTYHPQGYYTFPTDEFMKNEILISKKLALSGNRIHRKAVYAAGCNLGIGHEPNGGVTTLEIPASELPPGKTLTAAVRPLTSLGTSGRPIATEFKALGGRTS